MIEQGSEDWFSIRLGKVTASRVKDVMAKGRGNQPSATRKNYMMQLLCERLTGEREDTFTSQAMMRGVELEPLARAAYEIHRGVVVDEVGFIVHPDCEHTGASPDGLVSGGGLVEIKCPHTAQHVKCLQSGKPDPTYMWQMQHQMACTGRDWCDFVSFDDRLPEELQLFVVEVERDQDAIDTMMSEIDKFLAELSELEAEMIQIIKNREQNK